LPRREPEPGERKPPFSPTDVVSEFCETLKGYRIASVEGDRYGAEFVQEQFRKNGVGYVEAERTTSDYVAGFLPILNSGVLAFWIIASLCSLERRASRVGAKDQIGHPPGQAGIEGMHRGAKSAEWKFLRRPARHERAQGGLSGQSKRRRGP
jgi:hypothetical protein